MLFIDAQEHKLQSDAEQGKGSGITYADTGYKAKLTQTLIHKETTPGHHTFNMDSKLLTLEHSKRNIKHKMEHKHTHRTLGAHNLCSRLKLSSSGVCILKVLIASN